MYEKAVIAGRYRLLGRAGHGAMGTVWRAKDERLDRIVAVKQLFPDSPADVTAAARTRARAVREARLAARLRHPHAVAVYDVVEYESTSYLVLEYLPSHTLTDLLDRHGPLAPDYVAKLGAQLASALAAAHAQGVLHRDISPNNVLVINDGSAKIADFGVAHAHGEGSMTGRGLVVGTPAYLAPEVADGMTADFPSDVYSLGATLYTALEGRPPSGTDENQLALLKRIVRDEIVPPRTAGPVTDIVLDLLRRDPAERPTMAEAERMLSRGTAPQPGTPAGPAPTTPVPVRTRGARIGLIGSAFLLAGLAALAGTLLAGPRSASASATAEPASAPPDTTPALSTTATEPASCAARYQVVKSWSDGFQVLVTVRNSSHTGLSSWTVSWAYPAGTSVDDLWDGRLVETGARSAIASAEWNSVLKPGESTTFGFIALARGGGRAAPVTDCRPAE